MNKIKKKLRLMQNFCNTKKLYTLYVRNVLRV